MVAVAKKKKPLRKSKKPSRASRIKVTEDPPAAESNGAARDGETVMTGEIASSIVDKLDHLNHWAQDIESAERECTETEQVWNADKKKAKESKSEYDAAVLNLRRLVKQRNNPQMTLPLKDAGELSPADQAALDGVNAKADASKRERDETWRAVKLETASNYPSASS